MLVELRIENFAIIDRLELQFSPGLITFTGETGAGKSIIIDAVETLLGGRADSTMVRTGAERAYVEATFRIDPQSCAAVQAILEREELLDSPEYLTISREIRSAGRNIARVNGRTVSVALLHELGEYVVDVHGQSEHLSLLRVREHLGLLDRFANVEGLLKPYQDSYHRLVNVRKELKALRQAEREAVQRSDLLTFQVGEIDAAHLRPGEEEDLRDERTRLANAEGLATLAQQGVVLLDEDDPESPSVTDRFGKVLDTLVSLARIDPTQSALVDQAEGLFAGLTEIARELRSYAEGIEFNPKRLDRVEERIGLIQSLKRKYGENIPEILDYAEKARIELDNILHAGERIEALQSEEEALLVELGRRGQALSEQRRTAAENLKTAIEQELEHLHMSEARFQVSFQQQEDPEGALVEDGRRLSFDANGLERVEFLIAPNPGEGFKPLAKIASGGETSRLMLALKNVLARADHVPTLIFDEIDQGIGGRVGGIVGRKLWELARLHQVLCITHLPQLAAYGEQHFQVQKQILDGRTLTLVDDLSGEARVNELAQMLGDLSESTRHSAREMLQSANAVAK